MFHRVNLVREEPGSNGIHSLANLQQLQSCGACPSSRIIASAMDVQSIETVKAFITKDGSEIRELLAYRNSVIRNQSLAEARLAVSASTQEHYHRLTEEIYFITNGSGRIRIEGEIREVTAGDAIAILPGQKHKLWNTGTGTLRLLCCCAPAYEDGDTVITEKAG